MNVLFPPRIPIKYFRGGWLECVFRPCNRYKKHTKPLPWPKDLNLCPASWLTVTAGLPSRLLYTQASFLPRYTYPRPLEQLFIQTSESLKWLPFILT